MEGEFMKSLVDIISTLIAAALVGSFATAWLRPRRGRALLESTAMAVAMTGLLITLAGLAFTAWKYLPRTEGSAADKAAVGLWPLLLLTVGLLVMYLPFGYHAFLRFSQRLDERDSVEPEQPAPEEAARDDAEQDLPGKPRP